MAELIAHGQSVNTIFDLFGNLENDITKSIAWTLAKCPKILESVIYFLTGCEVEAADVLIRYQVSEEDKGITDLEVIDNKNIFIIIEAKRGWILPVYKQLYMYSERKSFKQNPAQKNDSFNV